METLELPTVTRINGNGQPYTSSIPKLIMMGFCNDVALSHIKDNTGLEFKPGSWGNLEVQPTDFKQITALFMTYNFKSRYYDNWNYTNTIVLKNDHHTGFDVDSICYDCVKHNHIEISNLEPGQRLSC